MMKIGQFAICSHTCVKKGCQNGTTNSILWNRNAAIYRHACAPRPHPDCSQECPAFDFLGTGSSVNAVRLPTEDEYQEFLQQSAKDSDCMDVDEELTRFDSPVSTTTQNAEITYLLNTTESAFPGTETIRPFKIIFIPDATLAIKQKSVAMNDLAFVRAQISEDEYNAIEYLTGSVHYISKNKDQYKVIMQEWVSSKISCRSFVQILISRQLYVTIIMQRWNRQGSRVDANRRFNMSYMTYDSFFAFLQRPHENGHTWNILSTADCVMGGFDLDSPYL